MVTRGASVNPNGGLIITAGLEAIDGSLFSFLGAEISLDARLDNPRTNIIGIDENGQLVWDPIGTGGWLSVKRVVFSGQTCCGPGGIELLNLTIDNVNATVIPVPAPVVLLFSGLLALIPFRCKPL